MFAAAAIPFPCSLFPRLPDKSVFAYDWHVHLQRHKTTPVAKARLCPEKNVSWGKVTFPVRGKVTFPFTSFQVLLQVQFFTLYTPPFPSPFPLRPPSPTRFPIWESSWEHRDSRRGSHLCSRFCSSPCSCICSKLWFPLSGTTSHGLEALILRRFEAIQGDSMGG